MLGRLIVIVAAVVISTVAHAADPAAAAARFRQAHRAVASISLADGFEVDSSQAAVTALQAQWAAGRDVVVALLDRDRGSAPAAIVRAARRDAGLGLYLLRLDADTLLVSMKAGQFGTVFVAHRGPDGHYRPAVALDALPATSGDRMPELAAWRPAQSGKDCQHRVPEPQWNRCGPLAVDRLIRLSDEAGGARRFAILADRVAAAGGTARYQVSIWRWDGRAATPLLARTLFQVIDKPVFAGQDARGITLRADEQYESLSACGECAGRQMIWRFDLPPTGARPPRVRSVSPELDLVDRLYTRLLAHRSAGDLAAPSVVARLRNVELDMMNSWRYLGDDRGARLLCLDALGFEKPQIFRIVRRGQKLWIADVAFARAHACEGQGSH